MKTICNDFEIKKIGSKNQVYLNLNKLDFDIPKTKYIMKKIMQKYRFNKNIEFILDDESLLERVNEFVLENKYHILVLINTLKIKEKKQRYNYIYDKICYYLDSVCTSKKLCDFKDDVCYGKRISCVKNGCCHHFKNRYFMGITEKPKLCEYQVGKSCTAQSIGCKMFLCDEIIKNKGVKFTVENVLLIKYFYNFIQKIIILSSVFYKKERIIKNLCRFGI